MAEFSQLLLLCGLKANKGRSAAAAHEHHVSEAHQGVVWLASNIKAPNAPDPLTRGSAEHRNRMGQHRGAGT